MLTLYCKKWSRKLLAVPQCNLLCSWQRTHTSIIVNDPYRSCLHVCDNRSFWVINEVTIVVYIQMSTTHLGDDHSLYCKLRLLVCNKLRGKTVGANKLKFSSCWSWTCCNNWDNETLQTAMRRSSSFWRKNSFKQDQHIDISCDTLLLFVIYIVQCSLSLKCSVQC